jgi:hypothetical protein
MFLLCSNFEDLKMNINLNNALILLDQAIEEITNGFVRCETCGDQEDTKDLDFVDDLKMARAEVLIAVHREKLQKEDERA